MDAETRRSIHDGIVALADGDRAIFATVFDALWPVVLAFVRRATHDRADAEDLAQETLLRIFARIAEFDRTRDGVSWAFGIAAYEVRTYRRRRERRRETPADTLDTLPGRGASHEQDLIQRDLHAALHEALGSLTDAERELLLSESPRPSADADAPQIETAGSAVAPATIRKRRQRALERLRAVWRTVHG